MSRGRERPRRPVVAPAPVLCDPTVASFSCSYAVTVSCLGWADAAVPVNWDVLGLGLSLSFLVTLPPPQATSSSCRTPPSPSPTRCADGERERCTQREGERERDGVHRWRERERDRERDTHESTSRALSLSPPPPPRSHMAIHITNVDPIEWMAGTPTAGGGGLGGGRGALLGQRRAPPQGTHIHTHMHAYIHTYIHTPYARSFIGLPGSLSSSVRPPVLSRPSTVVRIHPTTHLTPYPHLFACLPACLPEAPCADPPSLRHLSLSNEPSLHPSLPLLMAVPGRLPQHQEVHAHGLPPRRHAPARACVPTVAACMGARIWFGWLHTFVCGCMHVCTWLVPSQILTTAMTSTPPHIKHD